MTYKTKNQNSAIYLLALKNLGKIRMVGYTRNTNNELEVEFEPAGDCELAIENYFSGQAAWIAPKVLLDAVGEWKSLLRETDKRRLYED